MGYVPFGMQGVCVWGRGSVTNLGLGVCAERSVSNLVSDVCVGPGVCAKFGFGCGGAGGLCQIWFPNDNFVGMRNQNETCPLLYYKDCYIHELYRVLMQATEKKHHLS